MMENEARKGKLELYDVAERRLEAFCRRAQEIFRDAELAKKNIDRFIDEMIDGLVLKYQEEEPPSEQARLQKMAEEIRVFLKNSKAKYLRS